MATTMSISRTRELPSVKVQALATLAAIVGAVAIPQIFHVVGAISGLGTGLGEAFLPMHLPIILVGLLAGIGDAFTSGVLSYRWRYREHIQPISQGGSIW